ncbi:hypothetical protein M513_13114 [Trichuris suis]|uniref:Uncharacterized protein n=1 Tax=Trichuris suis TaxID=68888 RepID=A0A085LM16_9BILA|nr:hypothetical protein M513_13114 [Trichuris suis]
MICLYVGGIVIRKSGVVVNLDLHCVRIGKGTRCQVSMGFSIKECKPGKITSMYQLVSAEKASRPHIILIADTSNAMCSLPGY